MLAFIIAKAILCSQTNNTQVVLRLSAALSEPPTLVIYGLVMAGVKWSSYYNLNWKQYKKNWYTDYLALIMALVTVQHTQQQICLLH